MFSLIEIVLLKWVIMNIYLLFLLFRYIAHTYIGNLKEIWQNILLLGFIMMLINK